MIRFTAFIFCVLASLVSSGSAFAQANLPEFTVLESGELSLNTQQAGEKSYKEKMQNINNMDMRAHLLLQNEITMLGALQDWQAQVASLQDTYETAGLPFVQPPPPRSICEQVPSNTLCNDAYPDLAPRPAISETPEAAINTLAISGVATKSAPIEPVMSQANNYEWASISCVTNNCQAVLLDKTQNTTFTVENGEILQSGVTVTDITPTGVKVRENSKTIKLRSALPQNTQSVGDSTNLTTADELGNQLSTLPESALLNVEPVQPIVIDDGSSNPAPALGPTGLF